MRKPNYEDGYRDALRDVRAWFDNNKPFLIPIVFKIACPILKIFEEDILEFFKLKECYAFDWDCMDSNAPPKRRMRGAEK
jgi:hypothetical protein